MYSIIHEYLIFALNLLILRTETEQCTMYSFHTIIMHIFDWKSIIQYTRISVCRLQVDAFKMP